MFVAVVVVVTVVVVVIVVVVAAAAGVAAAAAAAATAAAAVAVAAAVAATAVTAAVAVAVAAAAQQRALLGPREGVRNIFPLEARHPLLTVGGSMAAPISVQEVGAVLCTLFAIGTVRLLFDLESLIE